jgi:hypothetical protein
MSFPPQNDRPRFAGKDVHSPKRVQHQPDGDECGSGRGSNNKNNIKNVPMMEEESLFDHVLLLDDDNDDKEDLPMPPSSIVSSARTLPPTFETRRTNHSYGPSLVVHDNTPPFKIARTISPSAVIDLTRDVEDVEKEEEEKIESKTCCGDDVLLRATPTTAGLPPGRSDESRTPPVDQVKRGPRTKNRKIGCNNTNAAKRSALDGAPTGPLTIVRCDQNTFKDREDLQDTASHTSDETNRTACSVGGTAASNSPTRTVPTTTTGRQRKRIPFPEILHELLEYASSSLSPSETLPLSGSVFPDSDKLLEADSFTTRKDVSVVAVAAANTRTSHQPALSSLSSSSSVKEEWQNIAQLRFGISWCEPDGTSFVITNRTLLQTTLLAKYFPSQRQPRSFERNLNMWGFEAVNKMRPSKIYSHPGFRRGKIDWCRTEQLSDVAGRSTRRPMRRQSQGGQVKRSSPTKTNSICNKSSTLGSAVDKAPGVMGLIAPCHEISTDDGKDIPDSAAHNSDNKKYHVDSETHGPAKGASCNRNTAIAALDVTSAGSKWKGLPKSSTRAHACDGKNRLLDPLKRGTTHETSYYPNTSVPATLNTTPVVTESLLRCVKKCTAEWTDIPGAATHQCDGTKQSVDPLLCGPIQGTTFGKKNSVVVVALDGLPAGTTVSSARCDKKTDDCGDLQDTAAPGSDSKVQKKKPCREAPTPSSLIPTATNTQKRRQKVESFPEILHNLLDFASASSASPTTSSPTAVTDLDSTSECPTTTATATTTTPAEVACTPKEQQNRTTEQFGISWCEPDGKTFIITNRELLQTTLLSKFFPHQSKPRSFERNLNLWGFQSIAISTSKTSLTNPKRFHPHPGFVRGEKQWCRTRMQHIGNKRTRVRNTETGISVPTKHATLWLGDGGGDHKNNTDTMANSPCPSPANDTTTTFDRLQRLFHPDEEEEEEEEDHLEEDHCENNYPNRLPEDTTANPQTTGLFQRGHDAQLQMEGALGCPGQITIPVEHLPLVACPPLSVVPGWLLAATAASTATIGAMFFNHHLSFPTRSAQAFRPSVPLNGGGCGTLPIQEDSGWERTTNHSHSHPDYDYHRLPDTATMVHPAPSPAVLPGAAVAVLSTNTETVLQRISKSSLPEENSFVDPTLLKADSHHLPARAAPKDPKEGEEISYLVSSPSLQVSFGMKEMTRKRDVDALGLGHGSRNRLWMGVLHGGGYGGGGGESSDRLGSLEEDDEMECDDGGGERN